MRKAIERIEGFGELDFEYVEQLSHSKYFTLLSIRVSGLTGKFFVPLVSEALESFNHEHTDWSNRLAYGGWDLYISIPKYDKAEYEFSMAVVDAEDESKDDCINIPITDKEILKRLNKCMRKRCKDLFS